MASLRRHGGAAAVSVLFAVAWTYPLVLNLSTHIPGPGVGDNVTFLWNFWWMRAALTAGQDPFFTTALLAPGGVDLTLHTHTMMPAFAGATVLGALPVAVALNLTILAGVALNAFCAYLLAWRVTRDMAGALMAGLVFGGAPYFSGHLYGHFNLTMAWTIPLFALAAINGLRGSRAWAVIAGVVLGLTAYIDYYYVVFEGALGLVLLACLDRDWSVGPRVPRDPRVPRSQGAKVQGSGEVLTVVSALLAIDVVLIVSILVTGGFELAIGGRRVSFHTVFNPLQVLWLLVFVWLIAYFRPVISARRTASWPGVAGRLLLAGAAFVLVAAPVIWHGIELIARGDYVTQRYFWRSAPAGVDLATLVIGNPFRAVFRSRTQHLYDVLGIDNIESMAWLGLLPLALGIFAVHRCWRRPPDVPVSLGDGVRVWTMAGAVFFVWALGSHLMVFGVNTAMVLPQAAMRYIPLVGNARIPGRAMVMVWLALSVLVAAAIAVWQVKETRRRSLLALIVAAIVLDFLPAPIPLTALDRPALYETLRDRPESGAVLELPMGIRDGFGERGLLDHRTLVYQSIHGRPITGGFVARLPPSTLRAYEQDPLLKTLLELSSGNGNGTALAVPDRAASAARLQELGIAFVILNRRLSSPELMLYVENVLPLTLVQMDEDRSLYLVQK